MPDPQHHVSKMLTSDSASSDHCDIPALSARESPATACHEPPIKSPYFQIHDTTREMYTQWLGTAQIQTATIPRIARGTKKPVKTEQKRMSNHTTNMHVVRICSNPDYDKQRDWLTPFSVAFFCDDNSDITDRTTDIYYSNDNR